MHCGLASQCASCKKEFSSLCEVHDHIRKGINHHGFLYSVHLSKDDRIIVYPSKDICSKLYMDLHSSNKPQDCKPQDDCSVNKSTGQVLSSTHSNMKSEPLISIEKNTRVSSCKKNKTDFSNRCNDRDKVKKCDISKRLAVVDKTEINKISTDIQTDMSGKQEIMTPNIVDEKMAKCEPLTQSGITKCKKNPDHTEEVHVSYIEIEVKPEEKSLEEIAADCTDAIDKSLNMLKPAVIVMRQSQILENKSKHTNTSVKDFAISDNHSNQVSKNYYKSHNSEKQFLKKSDSVCLDSRIPTPSPVRIAKKPKVLTLKQSKNNRPIVLYPSLNQKKHGNRLKSSSHSVNESITLCRCVDQEIVKPVLLVNNKHCREDIGRDIVKKEQLKENHIEKNLVDRNSEISDNLVIVKREVEDNYNDDMSDQDRQCSDKSFAYKYVQIKQEEESQIMDYTQS